MTVGGVSCSSEGHSSSSASRLKMATGRGTASQLGKVVGSRPHHRSVGHVASDSNSSGRRTPPRSHTLSSSSVSRFGRDLPRTGGRHEGISCSLPSSPVGALQKEKSDSGIHHQHGAKENISRENLHPSSQDPLKDASDAAAIHPVEVVGRFRDDPLGDCAPSSVVLTPSRRNVRVDNKVYVLDGVSVSREESLEKFYQRYVQKRIEDVVEGGRCTVMMYGPTGSGKSYTTFAPGKGLAYQAVEQMMGCMTKPTSPLRLGEGGSSGGNDGMRRRSGGGGGVLSEVFAGGSNGGGPSPRAKRPLVVQATVLEIYNERVYDLLASTSAAGAAGQAIGNASIRGREGPGGEKIPRVEVRGGEAVGSLSISGSEPKNLMRAIERGIRRRVQACTELNHRSSRSHCMLILRIPEVGGKLTIVDMAGSESAERAGVTGEEVKQTGAINKGLRAWRRVVDAKVTGDAHVPYRDSKLTELLRESFEGEGRILMILCASPAASQVHETIGTLTYGAKAKRIIKPVIVERAEGGEAAKEMETLRACMEKNDSRLEMMKVSWERRDGEKDAQLREMKRKIDVLQRRLKDEEDKRVREVETIRAVYERARAEDHEMWALERRDLLTKVRDLEVALALESQRNALVQSEEVCERPLVEGKVVERSRRSREKGIEQPYDVACGGEDVLVGDEGADPVAGNAVELNRDDGMDDDDDDQCRNEDDNAAAGSNDVVSVAAAAGDDDDGNDDVDLYHNANDDDDDDDGNDDHKDGPLNDVVSAGAADYDDDDGDGNGDDNDSPALYPAASLAAPDDGPGDDMVDDKVDVSSTSAVGHFVNDGGTPAGTARIAIRESKVSDGELRDGDGDRSAVGNPGADVLVDASSTPAADCVVTDGRSGATVYYADVVGQSGDGDGRRESGNAKMVVDISSTRAEIICSVDDGGSVADTTANVVAVSSGDVAVRNAEDDDQLALVRNAEDDDQSALIGSTRAVVDMSSAPCNGPDDEAGGDASASAEDVVGYAVVTPAQNPEGKEDKFPISSGSEADSTGLCEELRRKLVLYDDVESSVGNDVSAHVSSSWSGNDDGSLEACSCFAVGEPTERTLTFGVLETHEVSIKPMPTAPNLEEMGSDPNVPICEVPVSHHLMGSSEEDGSCVAVVQVPVSHHLMGSSEEDGSCVAVVLDNQSVAAADRSCIAVVQNAVVGVGCADEKVEEMVPSADKVPEDPLGQQHALDSSGADRSCVVAVQENVGLAVVRGNPTVAVEEDGLERGAIETAAAENAADAPGDDVACTEAEADDQPFKTNQELFSCTCYDEGLERTSVDVAVEDGATDKDGTNLEGADKDPPSLLRGEADVDVLSPSSAAFESSAAVDSQTADDDEVRVAELSEEDSVPRVVTKLAACPRVLGDNESLVQATAVAEAAREVMEIAAFQENPVASTDREALPPITSTGASVLTTDTSALSSATGVTTQSVCMDIEKASASNDTDMAPSTRTQMSVSCRADVDTSMHTAADTSDVSMPSPSAAVRSPDVDCAHRTWGMRFPGAEMPSANNLVAVASSADTQMLSLSATSVQASDRPEVRSISPMQCATPPSSRDVEMLLESAKSRSGAAPYTGMPCCLLSNAPANDFGRQVNTEADVDVLSPSSAIRSASAMDCELGVSARFPTMELGGVECAVAMVDERQSAEILAETQTEAEDVEMISPSSAIRSVSVVDRELGVSVQSQSTEPGVDCASAKVDERHYAGILAETQPEAVPYDERGVEMLAPSLAIRSPSSAGICLASMAREDDRRVGEREAMKVLGTVVSKVDDDVAKIHVAEKLACVAQIVLLKESELAGEDGRISGEELALSPREETEVVGTMQGDAIAGKEGDGHSTTNVGGEGIESAAAEDHQPEEVEGKDKDMFRSCLTGGDDERSAAGSAECNCEMATSCVSANEERQVGMTAATSPLEPATQMNAPVRNVGVAAGVSSRHLSSAAVSEEVPLGAQAGLPAVQCDIAAEVERKRQAYLLALRKVGVSNGTMPTHSRKPSLVGDENLDGVQAEDEDDDLVSMQSPLTPVAGIVSNRSSSLVHNTRYDRLSEEMTDDDAEEGGRMSDGLSEEGRKRKVLLSPMMEYTPSDGPSEEYEYDGDDVGLSPMERDAHYSGLEDEDEVQLEVDQSQQVYFEPYRANHYPALSPITEVTEDFDDADANEDGEEVTGRLKESSSSEIAKRDEEEDDDQCLWDEVNLDDAQNSPVSPPATCLENASSAIALGTGHGPHPTGNSQEGIQVTYVETKEQGPHLNEGREEDEGSIQVSYVETKENGPELKEGREEDELKLRDSVEGEGGDAKEGSLQTGWSKKTLEGEEEQDTQVQMKSTDFLQSRESGIVCCAVAGNPTQSCVALLGVERTFAVDAAAVEINTEDVLDTNVQAEANDRSDCAASLTRVEETDVKADSPRQKNAAVSPLVAKAEDQVAEASPGLGSETRRRAILGNIFLMCGSRRELLVSVSRKKDDDSDSLSNQCCDQALPSDAEWCLDKGGKEKEEKEEKEEEKDEVALPDVKEEATAPDDGDKGEEKEQPVLSLAGGVAGGEGHLQQDPKFDHQVPLTNELVSLRSGRPSRGGAVWEDEDWLSSPTVGGGTAKRLDFSNVCSPASSYKSMEFSPLASYLTSLPFSSMLNKNQQLQSNSHSTELAFSAALSCSLAAARASADALVMTAEGEGAAPSAADPKDGPDASAPSDEPHQLPSDEVEAEDAHQFPCDDEVEAEDAHGEETMTLSSVLTSTDAVGAVEEERQGSDVPPRRLQSSTNGSVDSDDVVENSEAVQVGVVPEGEKSPDVRSSGSAVDVVVDKVVILVSGGGAETVEDVSCSGFLRKSISDPDLYSRMASRESEDTAVIGQADDVGIQVVVGGGGSPLAARLTQRDGGGLVRSASARTPQRRKEAEDVRAKRPASARAVLESPGGADSGVGLLRCRSARSVGEGADIRSRKSAINSLKDDHATDQSFSSNKKEDICTVYVKWEPIGKLLGKSTVRSSGGKAVTVLTVRKGNSLADLRVQIEKHVGETKRRFQFVTSGDGGVVERNHETVLKVGSLSECPNVRGSRLAILRIPASHAPTSVPGSSSAHVTDAQVKPDSPLRVLNCNSSQELSSEVDGGVGCSKDQGLKPAGSGNVERGASGLKGGLQSNRKGSAMGKQNVMSSRVIRRPLVRSGLSSPGKTDCNTPTREA